MMIATTSSILPWVVTAFVIMCTVLIQWRFLRGTKKPKDDGSKAIPCPWALPIVGNLPNLYWAGYKPEELMNRWAQRYGDIFSFKLGTTLVVVLNNFNLIHKAWHHPKLQDRASPLVYIKALGPGKGLTFANGEQWKESRTFVLNMFRKLGVGKMEFEDVVVQEAKRINQEILRQGCVLDVSYIFSMASCNMISKVVFNQQLEYTDTVLQEQVKIVLKHFQLAGPGSLNSMTSLFSHFRFGPGQRIVNNYKVMRKHWSKHIQAHLQQNDRSENEDIVDAYLEQLQKHLKAGTETNYKFPNLLWLLRDLYVAGTETTATTLRWAMLFLATHPEKQKKCHKEMDEVFSKDYPPCYSDRIKLPYINAFIMETLRLGDILPLGVAHKAGVDVMLGEYLISKGTIVTSNIRAVSMDPELFNEPYTFRPERFLTDEGLYQPKEEFIPFGIGKRVCVGEQIARIELFIWFTHLLQKFEVKMADDSAKPDITAARTGLVRCPLPFKVQFTER